MYGRIFESLYRGTMHGMLGPQTVFIYMLVHCDQDGNVTVSPQAISHDTGLELEEVMAAIGILESPDARSTTPDEEGRRIVQVGTGWCWHITNHGKYQDLRNMDERRRQTREAVARHRERVSDSKQRVSNGKLEKAMKAPVDVDVAVDLEEDRIKHLSENGESDSLTVEAWFNEVFWDEYPRKEGKKSALKAMMRAFKGKRGKAEDDLGVAIMDGLRRHQGVWLGKEPQFIPLPASWINGQRWEDEL